MSEATNPRSPAGDGPFSPPLSNRETEILALLAKRLSNKEIAEQLRIMPETVKRHAANVYQQLDVHGRRQAVERATSLGVLRPLWSGREGLACQPFVGVTVSFRFDTSVPVGISARADK